MHLDAGTPQIKVFVSYSHRDGAYLDDDSLLGFLGGLESEGVAFWDDRELRAGDRWDDEIRRRILESHIALVLVSQAFLDSSYCTDVEINGFLEKARDDGLVIFPIILSACEWERHDWLSSTQFLPRQGETLEEQYSEPGKRKRLFLQIRKHLRTQVERVRETLAATTGEGALARSVQSSSIKAERRQLTLLRSSLELASITAEPLEPDEEIEIEHEILPRFEKVCRQVLGGLQAFFEPPSSDGLVAYFGYPTAHEDDARRAVRSAFEIRDGVLVLSSELEEEFGVRLDLRTGIDTGLGIVAATAAAGQPSKLTATGCYDSATELMHAAGPGDVLLGDATRRLLDDLVDVEAVDGEDGAGSFRVVRVRDEQATGAVVPLQTPLVGRDRELELLLERWQLAREGSGQLVLLEGEPGFGKSRLTKALIANAAEEESRRLTFRCSAYHTTSAFYPVLHSLQRGLSFEPREDPASKLDKIGSALEAAGLPRDQTLPLIASLLSLPVPEDSPALRYDPKHLRDKTMEALLHWIGGMAAEKPLLLVVEDLHWIDPSTLDFLTLVVENLAGLPLLALFNFRPEFSPPWPNRSYVLRMNLTRLTHPQVRTMIDELTGGKPLPAMILDQLAERTDGVPLFVEELTKAVFEADILEERDGDYVPSAAWEIPSTLRESLMARLDQLGLAKNVAQMCSTLGREFSYELLTAVSSWDEEQLRPHLSRLVDAELLFRRGLLKHATYIFKHALIRDIAYQSLLKKKRQDYHRRIARALEEKFPEARETQPELLAKHFTEAGLWQQAIDYWKRAGQRALARSAPVESVAHFQKGLELCDHLPVSLESKRLRLELSTSLGVPMTTTRGHASPEVERLYKEAEALCREVGEPQQKFQVLAGSWRFHWVRADFERALALAHELRTISEELGDPTSRLMTCRALCSTLFFLGRFEECRENARTAIALYEGGATAEGDLIVTDPAVVCLSYDALCRWQLGHVAEAREECARAVEIARASLHAHTLVVTLYFDTWLAMIAGDSDTVFEQAEELIVLCKEQAFSFMITGSFFMRGWALYGQGQHEEGLAEMDRSLTAWRQTGARLVIPFWLYWSADAHRRQGDLDKALDLSIEAASESQARGEIWWRPQIYRLQGDLLREGRQAAEESEQCRRRALDLAREIGTPLQALRAALDLAETWQREGRQEEAREVLRTSLEAFDEGADSSEIRTARALAAEL